MPIHVEVHFCLNFHRENILQDMQSRKYKCYGNKNFIFRMFVLSECLKSVYLDNTLAVIIHGNVHFV